MWTGDLPGIGLASGFSHAGGRACHWCRHKSWYDHATCRNIYGDYRRYLPAGDVLRHDPGFDEHEDRPEPKARTHEQACADGLAATKCTMAVTNAAHPATKNGISYVTVLVFLHMFDIIWDFLPDMMHILKGSLGGHLIPLLKGQRRPGAPKRPAAARDEDGEEWETIKERHREITKKCMAWELLPAAQRKCDDRSLDLGGGKRFLRTNLALFRRTGSWLGHDWVNLVATAAGRLILHCVLGPAQAATVFMLFDVLFELLNANCPEDRADVLHALGQLKYRVVVALTHWEKDLPATELMLLLHELLHMPDAIARWNNLRNFWAFFGERYHICPLTLNICPRLCATCPRSPGDCPLTFLGCPLICPLPQ